MPRQDLIQYRSGTAAQWASANPVLDLAEVGYDVTNNQIRVGDGVSAWAQLDPLDSAALEAASSAASAASAARQVADATADTVENGRLSEPELSTTIAEVGGDLFATSDQVDSAYTVATRGYPTRRRSVRKMAGFFGATGHGYTINTAGGGGTGNANDTSQPMLGTQAISLDYSTSATAAGQINNTALASFSVVDSYIRLTFRYTGTITAFTVYLSSDTSFTNRIQRNFLSTGDFPADTDHTVDISISDFTTTGSPNLAAIVAARVIIGMTAGQAGKGWVGQIAVTDDAKVQLPNGAVIISLDDTNSDHWTYARPKLAQYGFPATIYPVCESFGLAGKLTIAQAQYMQDVHNFDVGYHAFTAQNHSDWGPGVTEAQVRAQLESIIAFNRTNNFRGDSFAYPNVYSNAMMRRVVADYCRSARGGNGNYNETFPPGIPMNIRAINGASFTLAQMKAKVDAAKAGHSVAHFFFHALPTTVSALNDVARQDFYDLIDYIATQGVPVLTASQFMSLALTA